MRPLIVLLIGFASASSGQIDGGTAYEKFLTWRKEPVNTGLKWETAIEKCEATPRAEGLSKSDAAKTLSIILSRDEASLYDRIFAAPPTFQTSPSAVLVEAVKNRHPGKALDVAMGQGRNSIYLAQKGWSVSGFDVSKIRLAEARRLAALAGVKIDTVLASDEEFDFGVDEWDLIAILYPIEKRSVYRVRKALKSGGIVVVERSHKEAANAPFEFETNELLKIFDGF